MPQYLYLTKFTLSIYILLCSTDLSSEKLTRYDSKALHEIPANIDEGTTKLHIYNYKISKLPMGVFCSLRHMIDILARDNGMKYISPHAFDGTKIRILNLARNEISCVPDLSSIHKTLFNLFLSNNKIQGDCEENNRFLVHKKVSYDKLYLIDLSKNDLTTLPDICKKAQNLHFLDVSQNKLLRVIGIFHHKLHILKLDGLSLICDCQTLWIKQFQTKTAKPKVFNRVSQNHLKEL